VEFVVIVAKTNAAKSKESEKGKLRIGDDWNAIRIIALSQSNPLKAIAELVENSIDAGLPVEQVVERMIELSLYVEEKLKSM
jgi:Flp pilus assembly protein TadB